MSVCFSYLDALYETKRYGFNSINSSAFHLFFLVKDLLSTNILLLILLKGYQNFLQ